MTTTLLLFLVLAAAGILPAAFLYLRREPALPGRGLLLGLRAAALALIALLVVNPTLPWAEDDAPGDGAFWVLLEGSRALDVPHPEGGILRTRAVERTTAEARDGARIALAGPEPEGIDTVTLAEAAARPPVADLRPSLIRLAEAGADSVLLLSPLRISPAALERAVEGLPVHVRMERLGVPVRNAGVLELELPGRVPAGDRVAGALTVYGEGGTEADSVWIRVEEGDREVELLRVALPPAGSPLRLTLDLPSPADTGMVRYRASVELEGDVFPLDDGRVRWVRVGPPEGGIVLLSLEPDWEPRVLLPVLEAATGLEGEGYLRVGEDQWLPLARGDDPAGPVNTGHFLERVPRAGLLVIHGAGEGVPEWLPPALEAHPRVVHFPTGSEGARLASISPAPPQDGEWAPDADLPPSPVSPFLSGLALGALPPLTHLRPVGGDGGMEVLRLRSPRGGEARPAIILRETVRGRRAVALARGFWRWGNRSGTPREAYRGLWAGVAGWLLADDLPRVGAGEIRPLQRVFSLDDPLGWEAPGGAGRELVVRYWPVPDDPSELDDPATGAPGVTHRIRLDEAGRGRTGPLPPGRWHWRGEVDVPADLPQGDPRRLEGTGELEVEPWTGVLSVPPLDPVPDPPEPGPELLARAADGRDASSPLRTHPAPYLLLIALLCVEWIGRRRLGLR